MNKDVSLAIEDIDMRFLIHTLTVLIQGSVSQNFYLGPSSYFMIKKQVTFQ